MGSTAAESLPRRAVIIGASNVVRGLPWAIGAARMRLGAPLDVLIADGCGRSFGGPSRFLGRTLPGILESGLWTALDARPAAPTWALVTDLGNDIVYGHAVDTIATWLDRCLQRLRAVDARIVVSRPPLASVQRTGRLHYGIVRTLLFPSRRLSHGDALAAVADLDAAVVERATAHGADLVTPDPGWFGLDPIHVRRRHVPAAWAAMTAPWSDGASSERLPRARLPRLRPALRWVGTRRHETPQPTARLDGGIVLSVY